MAGNTILVHLLRGKRTARCLCRYRPHRRDYFGAPAIGEGNRQSNSRIVARHSFGVFNKADNVGREAGKLPDNLKANAIAT